ncbi:MAG: amidohydrolase family protein [Erysipelotrichaceae bacterium]|nr:amidohydrolase family protein [Erysipelotrichaceae bacterium]MDP3305540.1 amidohydrolase family protein [Erysipelotrichaceae bacterium]
MLDVLIRKANVNGAIVDIAIKDGVVVDIDNQIYGDATIVFDAKKRVTIPGFVDCHTHLDKCLLNEQQPYQEGTGPQKGALTYEMKKGFTVEDITIRAEKMIIRAIKAGTLHWRTNVDVDGSVGLRGIEALLKLKKKYENELHLQVTAFAQEGVFWDGQTEVLLEEALKMGADLVGGHTIAKGEGEKHIDFILDLAKKYNVDADFHLDESGNREHYLLPYLSKKIIEKNMQGRVNGIHLCTLSALTPEELNEAIDYIEVAQLKVTVAPTAISTRNIAPVKRLLKTGFPVGLASDNMRDFFNPLGSGDVKQVALLLSYLQRFFLQEEVDQIFKMITSEGAKVLSIKDYGIKIGAKADVTVLDALTVNEVIAYQNLPAFLVRAGVMVE